MQRAADVGGGSDGIAHIVQAIEDGDKVIIFARIFFRLGYFEGDAVGYSLRFAVSRAASMDSS